MTDDKLEALIEEYGYWYSHRDKCKADGEQAKQAILDYVEKEKQDEQLLRGRYHELIMAVASKYPDESRHDTALRYIKEAENKEGGIGEK